MELSLLTYVDGSRLRNRGQVNVADIPFSAQHARKTVPMRDLLGRATGPAPATWNHLIDAAGVYVVVRTTSGEVEFNCVAGNAIHATPTDPATLLRRWTRICRSKTSDIVYIGKADNLRNRVRQLARFGVGRARNHGGGEWMWQLTGIESTALFMQSCPDGKQVAFENWLLETFWNAHGDYPLANRDGPEGSKRWHP